MVFFFGRSRSLSLKAWHCIGKPVFPFLEIQAAKIEEISLQHERAKHCVNKKLVSNFVSVSLPLVYPCSWSVMFQETQQKGYWKLRWTNTGLSSLLYDFIFSRIFAPPVLAGLVASNYNICLLIPMTLSKSLLVSLPLDSLPLSASWACPSCPAWLESQHMSSGKSSLKSTVLTSVSFLSFWILDYQIWLS